MIESKLLWPANATGSPSFDFFAQEIDVIRRIA
jgi:hypothetical protein